MTSRRQFLGAAAVALSLPAVDTAAASEEPDEDDERPPLPPREQPEGYPRMSTLSGLYGGMRIPEADRDMSIHVTVWPNQPAMNIDINITFAGVEVGPSIDPDEARELAQTLIDAADEVEEWQAENITEAQRDAHW